MDSALRHCFQLPDKCCRNGVDPLHVVASADVVGTSWLLDRKTKRPVVAAAASVVVAVEVAVVVATFPVEVCSRPFY